MMELTDIFRWKDRAEANVIRRPTAQECARFGGRFNAVCRRPDGRVRWENGGKNLVVNEGLQHILDIVFSGDESAHVQVTTWYVGLVDDGPTIVAGDTLASHAGWTENTAYTGDRKAYVEVRTAQQLSNTASKASFAIDTDSQIIAGAFLCSVATGTSGVLMCGVEFTGGDKSADDGDTLEVTYTFSAADDGT